MYLTSAIVVLEFFIHPFFQQIVSEHILNSKHSVRFSVDHGKRRPPGPTVCLRKESSTHSCVSSAPPAIICHNWAGLHSVNLIMARFWRSEVKCLTWVSRD